MPYYQRQIEATIQEKFSQTNKAVLIYGPRQVGKTTLAKKILATFPDQDTLFLSGDNKDSAQWLSSTSLSELKKYIGSKTHIVIDEAQFIDNIGLTLKLMVDHFPDLHLMVTGSSSFRIAQNIGEPLVGRVWEYSLFPIAQSEISSTESREDTKNHLPERLILGGYPDILNTANYQDKIEKLVSLVDHYLYKDLLMFHDIRRADKIHDLLKLIAFQIGKDVSLNELANQLNIDLKTIERYLDLLEKSFVIKKVRGFSRNLRKEISKTARFYFIDTGVRNAIIRNFNDLSNRDDIGQLWENYCIAERLKKQNYSRIWSENYFWRTYDQKEIDWVEERDGKLFGYEMKWNSGKKTGSATKNLWKTSYPNSELEMIHQDNYLSFIS